MADFKIGFDLSQKTVQRIKTSSISKEDLKDNPCRLRKWMLDESIENFLLDYPEYQDRDYKELLSDAEKVGPSSELGRRIANYCFTVDHVKTFENAQEFSISKKSAENIITKIRDYEEYSKSFDFSKLRVPFENIVVSMDGILPKSYSKYNLQCYLIEDFKYDDSGVKKDVYTVKVFSGVEFIVDVYFIIDKLPRIFISCPHTSSCSFSNIKNIFSLVSNPCCLKSPRVSKNCEDTGKETNNSKKSTRAEVALVAVFFMCEVFYRFYKQPTLVNRVANHVDKSKCESPEVARKRVESNIIRLTDKRYIYQSYESYTNGEKPRVARCSPCEHIRRGHTRRLKNGRVIYIEASVINEGKEKKIIRV